MGMPVKLSDDLVQLARAEAEAEDRSITSQIEHWAKLGRAAEAALGYAESRALKRSAGDLDRAVADVSTRRRVRTTLERLARSTERSAIADRLRRRTNAAYEADPKHPGMVVRVAPDGTRTSGRLVNRRFVAARD